MSHNAVTLAERNIWTAALLCVRNHGINAHAVAEREAESLKQNNKEASIAWEQVAACITELLRPVPKIGEYKQ